MEQIGIPDWIGLGPAGRSIPVRLRHIVVRKNLDDFRQLEIEADRRENADPEVIGNLVDRIDRRVRQLRQELARDGKLTPEEEEQFPAKLEIDDARLPTHIAKKAEEVFQMRWEKRVSIENMNRYRIRQRDTAKDD
jgi:hypothetical protein